MYIIIRDLDHFDGSFDLSWIGERERESVCVCVWRACVRACVCAHAR